MKKSDLERSLIIQLEMVKIQDYETEYRFHPERKWRFDLAWPQDHVMLACEIEGGIWTNGRHTRGSGFQKDCEKYNEAALLDWTVLRMTGSHIRNGSALNWIERYLIKCDERSQE